MKKNLVITIGRECGSSGRAIGRKLAESLGIKCYDKELLALAAKNSGLCEELFKTHDEKPTNSFLYSLVMDTYSMGYNTSAYMDMPINHKIFLAQFDTIKNLADKESCVIIGRCADFILKDNPDVVRLFFYAPKEDCIARVKTQNGGTEKEIIRKIEKTDKYRSDYYRYHTGKDWNDSRNYDFCLNTASMSYEKLVAVVKAYIEQYK